MQQYDKLNDLGRGATFKEISKTIVQNIIIPLPSLENQKRIVELLDRAQALINKRKEQIGHMDQLIQSLFYDMFGDPVTNLKGWKKETIFELVDKDRPITYGILMPKENIKPLGVPYIKVVDVKNGRILDKQVCHTTEAIETKYSRSRLREGDILFSIRGHVGRTCIVPKRYEGANITQDTARLAFTKKLSPHYAYYHLNSTTFQRNFQRFIKGAAVKGINLGDLKGLNLSIPPIDLQNIFAERVQQIETQKELMTIALHELEDNFNSIMQRAFKGEI